MINHVLSAIRNELNDFIKIKDPTNFGDLDIVVLSNLVTQNGELAFTTSDNNQSEHKIVITLVNVEEERILKEQNYFKKSDDDNIISLNPEIKINLSILFTAYSTSYDTSLRILSYLLGFFQMKNVFRIVLLLELFQSIIVRSISRFDTAALLMSGKIKGKN